jgi:hypothetical protein
MKDAYIVTFHAGTGGTFLSTLLYSWLSDTDLSSKPFREDVYASSHHLEDIVESNHSQIMVPGINYLGVPTMIHSSQTQALSFVEPVDKNKPFVVRQHFPIDLDIVNNKYTDYLNFNIYFTTGDIEVVCANIFLKNIVNTYNPGDKHNNWSSMSIGHSDPRNLTIKEREFYIKRLARHFYNTQETGHHTNFMSFCLAHQTINISFAQLMTQPEKVLNILEKGLDIPPPNHVHLLYQNYLNANLLMFNEFCPWIDYFTQNT